VDGAAAGAEGEPEGAFVPVDGAEEGWLADEDEGGAGGGGAFGGEVGGEVGGSFVGGFLGHESGEADFMA
jgi:hypothetical protein